MEVRWRQLCGMVGDAKSTINFQTLLDMLYAMFLDLSLPELTKNQNINVFMERYKKDILGIMELMVSPSDFEKLKVIGRGTFGEVQLVRHRECQMVYAMKLFNKYKIVECADLILEERNFMASVNSPWLVKLHYAFQDQQTLYMVMDYMPGGDLDYLIQKGRLPEKVANFYAAELVLAVEAVHSKKYIHFDIKPKNILFDAKGHLKLADYGVCIKMNMDNRVMLESPVGTPAYMSPEVVSSDTSACSCGKEVDWWSVGVCVYEMLVGDIPFRAKLEAEIYKKILNHEKMLRFPANLNIPKKAKDLICSLLSDRGVRLGRSGVKEIKQHPWFQHKQWTFSTIRNTEAPVVPKLKSDDDTSHFHEKRDYKSKRKVFPSPKVFQGNHLRFVGFSYLKEQNLPGWSGQLSCSQRELQDKVQTLEEKLKTCSTELETMSKELEEERAAFAQLREEEIERSKMLQIVEKRKQEMEKQLLATLDAEREEKAQLSQTISHLQACLCDLEDKVKSEAHTDNKLLETRLAGLEKKNSSMESDLVEENKKLIQSVGQDSTINTDGQSGLSERIKTSDSEDLTYSKSGTSGIQAHCGGGMGEGIQRTHFSQRPDISEAKNKTLKMKLCNLLKIKKSIKSDKAHKEMCHLSKELATLKASNSDHSEQDKYGFSNNSIIVLKQFHEMDSDLRLPLEKYKQKDDSKMQEKKRPTIRYSSTTDDVKVSKKVQKRKTVLTEAESNIYCRGHKFILTCYDIQEKCAVCNRRMWMGLECTNCLFKFHKYHGNVKRNCP